MKLVPNDRYAALPSKPLHTIALSDADASSAISFVEQKLRGTRIEGGLAPEQKKSVERLGGRASDLETVSQLASSVEYISPF